MDECIERANLIARIKYYVTHTPEGKGEHYAYSVMLNEVLNCPAADVAPVVHGEWAHLGGDEFCCTNCGFVITTEGAWERPTQKYCGDCGAKMDKGLKNI